MVNIFGSPKQPSLFPATISLSSISKEDYNVFYIHERSLFRVLLLVLHREVVQSIHVMGFLIWLEREGYTSKNLVEIFITSLSPDVIDKVFDEVIICLKFLAHKKFIFDNEAACRAGGDISRISLLQSFLDRKKIHMQDTYYNRDSIFDQVSTIASEVSIKAFDDILEEFIIGPTNVPFRYADQYLNQMVHPHGESNVNHVGLLKMYMIRHRNAVLNRLANIHSPSRDIEEEIPPENRTIFLTFSKGYPIFESEVRQYFTRIFGDFIESIHMQQVDPDNQPLFARIVARSSAIVRAVVNRDGGHGKSKYSINGKHVWARKYVKRKSSKEGDHN